MWILPSGKVPNKSGLINQDWHNTHYSLCIISLTALTGLDYKSLSVLSRALLFALAARFSAVRCNKTMNKCFPPTYKKIPTS
jgi:hypothetical protein